MRRARNSRRTLLGAAVLVYAALALPTLAFAVPVPKPGKPTVATGGVIKVRGTAATLVGTVNPRSFATSYNFEYGPTVAYGKRTTVANLPAGVLRVKVGQAVTGLLPGYHFRLVATNQAGTTLGRDRTFTPKSGKAKIVLPKSSEPTVYGATYVLSGTLTGAGNANRRLSLQSSSYPYLSPFSVIGLPTVTDATGHFVFRVAKMLTSTQFRVATLDPRPLYSPVATQKVAVRVLLKVRSSGHAGLVRLYGTVTPAVVGSHLSIQLRKAIRPVENAKSEERTTRYASQFSTVVKRATKQYARFSTIVKIRHTGRYRAFVVVKKGALTSGASASVTLHAAPGATGKGH